MPPQPTSGGQNQTLLELIYSLKGLAQTVEFFHQDLVRKIDEDSKLRATELRRIFEQLGRNGQTLAVLPITMSDRMEKLLGKLELQVGDKLEAVDEAIEEVRKKLWEYTKTAERAISQSEAVEPVDETSDVTGRIEVTNKGDIKMLINTKVLKKLYYVIVALAAGGGVYGLKEALASLFG